MFQTDSTPLIIAVMDGNLPEVERLVEQGADMETKRFYVNGAMLSLHMKIYL